MGRNFADMEPDEFWAPLMDDMDMIRGIEVMSPENIAVVDLVNASLFKQMRDLGMPHGSCGSRRHHGCRWSYASHP